MNTATKVYFGKVAMFRCYCDHCKQEALVINRRLQCCNRVLSKPEKYTKKRETITTKRKRISAHVKKATLTSQHGKCIYCNCDLMEPVWNPQKTKYEKNIINYDHILPWSYSGNNCLENIVASCSECNKYKSGLVFDSLEDAQVYILNKRGLT